MSTKTSIKRIALVAVSALTGGMLSVIAVPAANAEATLPVITVGSISGARAGGSVTVPVTVTVSAHAANETMTVAAKVISAPLTGGASNAPSVLGVTTSTTNAAGTERLFFGDDDGTVTSSAVYSAITASLDKTNDEGYVGVFVPGTTTAGTTVAAANGVGGVAATAIETALSSTANATTSKTFYLTVKPDLAGTYSILVSASGVAAHGSYVAGDTSTLVTFTTSSAPASATFTAIGGSSSTSPSGSKGALYKVTFKDASGNATQLVGDEAFTVSASAGYLAKATNTAGVFTSVSPSSATSISFGAADTFNGVGYFNAAYSTAAATVVLTGSGTGSLSSSVAASASYTTAAAAANAASLTFARAASANNAVTTGWKSSGSVIPTTSTSDTIELTRTTTTAAAYGYLTIVDNSGLITGTGSGGTLTYDRAYSMAAAGAYATVAIPHAACTTGTCYTVTDSASTSIGAVTSEASTLSSSSGSVTVTSPASSVRLAASGTVTFTVTVRDQFRNLVANTGVTATVSGRNSAKASQTVVTNASGVATYSFTDAGTTGTTDSISFSASGATASATITYGSTTAGSILVSTPSTNAYNATTLAGEDKYPKTYSEISSLDGAEAGIVSAYALLKDADGNVMSGLPVAWTISGTGCAVLSTSATTYTNASGVAEASIYAWTSGTCVVTATAGGKSDSANSYWSQTGAAEARSVEATVSGNSITAVVKDRFGNTIAGVPLKATRVSGAGGFGGSSSATGTTDDNGAVVFDVTGGDASAKITFNDAAASTYGTTDALKGLIDGTSTAAANTLTAYTAGTATLAEEGVGASYDAAGVNSVTVDVSGVTGSADAIDAANEATDAANAATDAANAAAEAADAATAAAQDAQAAVAALATEVAAMISGIKAQIIRLTNLVVKIQKKVNA